MELEIMIKLYTQVRLVRKDQCGPPTSLGPDDVWAQDEWDASLERVEAVAAQGPPLSAFWVAEYERRSRRNWDVFYRRNGDRAYRDRRYVGAVFPSTKGTLLELGCGVGNGVACADFERVVCLDFSKTAVDLLRRRFDFEARVCDIATEPLGEEDSSVDCVSCFFVLSALAPASLPGVASKIAHVLKPGGLVLVRDYGRYDQAQLRFRRGSKLADHWYVKNDGTRCFYFKTSDLDKLFAPPHFQGRATYVCRVETNRATAQLRRRVFVQASYRRCGSQSAVPIES